MKKLTFIINISFAVILLLAFSSCSKKDEPAKNSYFISTNYPITMIMREITGDSSSAVCLVPPGISEHTFAPKPVDINRIENSRAIFYIADNLDARLADFDNVKKYELIKMLPDSLISYFPGHRKTKNNIDPHFWSDPVAIKLLVPKLVKIMSELNPEKAGIYKKNSIVLIKKLDTLDKQIREKLSPFAGRNVMLFHPSLIYFLKRYGINYVGAVETAPAKQPTLQDIARLKKTIDSLGLKVLFAEPQLPGRSLEVLVHGTDIKILELDPIGGTPGRNNYFDLMKFNTNNLVKGLKR